MILVYGVLLCLRKKTLWEKLEGKHNMEIMMHTSTAK